MGGEECGKQEQNLVTVWVYIGVANEKNDAVGYIPYNLLCSFFFLKYILLSWLVWLSGLSADL